MNLLRNGFEWRTGYHPGNILTPMIDNEQFHRTLKA